MRIFIYPSAPDCANLGDVAMLQIALERLRELWPGASFSVLMRAPEAFKNHYPGVKLVSARGCKYWLRQNASRRPGFLFPLRKEIIGDIADIYQADSRKGGSYNRYHQPHAEKEKYCDDSIRQGKTNGQGKSQESLEPDIDYHGD